MQDAKVNVAVMQSRPNRTAWFAIILLGLIAAGFILSRTMNSPSKSPSMTYISQSALEQKYGLRVNLVAVTAAGGFVDLRLKIINGEKAKLLLADAENLPALHLDNGIILNPPADAKSQKIKFDDNGNVFIMYPNSRGAVKPGMPVTIVFGDIALEPIDAE